MNVISNLLVAAVAFLHFYFLILEMFLWTKPKGLKVFNQSLERAKATARLAANQGLYNGFLSAGLVWSLFEPLPAQAKALKIFFLSCVVIAGLYGAYSVNKKILFIQALPAFIGLILVFL